MNSLLGRRSNVSLKAPEVRSAEREKMPLKKMLMNSLLRRRRSLRRLLEAEAEEVELQEVQEQHQIEGGAVRQLLEVVIIGVEVVHKAPQDGQGRDRVR